MITKVPTSTNKSTRARTYGFSSIWILLILIPLLILIVISIIPMSIVSLQATSRKTDLRAASHIAEAGFWSAVSRLKNDLSFSGQHTPCDKGEFQTTVSPVESNPDQRLIVSRGFFPSLGGFNATRSIVGVVNTKGARYQIWNECLIVDNQALFGALFQMTSAPDTGKALAHSNKDFTILGIGSVDGKVTASGKISKLGIFNISHGFSENVEKIPFPTLDINHIRNQSKLIKETNSDYLTTSIGTVTLQGYYKGNVTVSGLCNIVLDGPVFIEGNLTVAVGAHIGKGLIVTGGQTLFTAVTDFTGGDELTLVSLGNLVFAGAGAFRGGFYVPNGSTIAAGALVLYGSVATRNLDLAGAAIFHFNTNFEPDPAVRGGIQVLSWQEQN